MINIGPMYNYIAIMNINHFYFISRNFHFSSCRRTANAICDYLCNFILCICFTLNCHCCKNKIYVSIYIYLHLCILSHLFKLYTGSMTREVEIQEFGIKIGGKLVI